MKFSSVIVCVSFCSVTFAFSDSNNPGSASTNFKEWRAEYQPQNIQNGYTQNSPNIQAARVPIDVSNAHSKTQRIDNINSQPAPIQYNHRLRPESYYPAHPATHVPKTRTTKHPDANLYPHSTMLHHIISNPKIKALYTASKPTKKYTIIHSNGTVEHTDEIHSVAARYPDYVMLKADDILSKYSKAGANIGNAKYSPQTVASVQTEKHPQRIQQFQHTNPNLPRTRIGQISQPPVKNYGGPLLNPTYNYKRIQNPQPQKLKSTSNQVPINTAPIVKGSYKSVEPVLSNTITQKNPTMPVAPSSQENKVNSNNFVQNVEISNPTAIYKPIRQAIEKIRNKSSNNQQVQSVEVKNAPFNKPLTEDVVAANPLPIYPNETPQLRTAISDKPYVSAAAKEAEVIPVITPIAKLPKQHPVLSLKNNDQEIILNPPIIKTVEEAINASNSNTASKYQIPIVNSISSKPMGTLPMSTEISLHETLPVILPQILSQNTPKEVETPTADTTIQEANKPSLIVTENISADRIQTTSLKNVLEESNKQLLESSKNGFNETKGIVQPDTTSFNNTETNKLLKEHIANSQVETANHTSSVANDLSNTSSFHLPRTWFSLSEESLWETLKKDAHNIYFFFLPPQPKVSKEIRTIIFPNGTTIEEITETVSGKGTDEEPKVTTRTRVV